MVILYNNLHLCLNGLSIELVWTSNQSIWEVDLDFSGFLKIIILYILNINTTREVAEGVVQLASWTIS